jgi:hypothetical protein
MSPKGKPPGRPPLREPFGLFLMLAAVAATWNAMATAIALVGGQPVRALERAFLCAGFVAMAVYLHRKPRP